MAEAEPTRLSAIKNKPMKHTTPFMIRAVTFNENKMSDGGRERGLLGVEVWKPSQNEDTERSAVRSIAWLGHPAT